MNRKLSTIHFQVLALFVFLCLFTEPSHAQTGPLEGMLEKLESHISEHPQEQVHLHLDKPYYTAGENIWFKTYVTIEPHNNLSGLSGLLYVDLVSPDNSIVQSLRLPLIAGIGVGDFQLADSLREGNYRIRAYTNWMRNFDSDSFYDRVLPIGNTHWDNIVTHSSFSLDASSRLAADIVFADIAGVPLEGLDVHYHLVAGEKRIDQGKSKTDEEGRIVFDVAKGRGVDEVGDGMVELTVVTPDKRTIFKTLPLKAFVGSNSIQFFPESGRLIVGNLTKVGFKALAPSGLGIEVSGYLEDETGTRVVEFQSTYAGMGSFSFIPGAGSTYTAKVTYADGNQREQVLPAVLPSGYALAVNNDMEERIFVQVFATEDLVMGQQVWLFALKDGEVFHVAKAELTSGEKVFSVLRKNLPIGVVQLALFAETMEPLAERMIFNMNGASALPATLTTDKQTYGTREEVMVRITTGHDTDTNRFAVLSASVLDLERVPIDNRTPEGDIYTSLLLNPYIKGYVETPGYYFEEINAVKTSQLDNVMLTHGWSRIKWEELTGAPPKKMEYLPEQGIGISGRVTREGSQKGVANTKVTLLSADETVGATSTDTDQEGRFYIENLLFYDSTGFLVQAEDSRGRKYLDVHLDEVSLPKVTQSVSFPAALSDLSPAMAIYLRNAAEQFEEMEKYGLREKAIMLEEAVATGTRTEHRLRNSANLNGPGRANSVVVVEDLGQACIRLADCLQGRLPGVIFQNGLAYSLRDFGRLYPLPILLDGNFMEPAAIMDVTVHDVDAVEFLISYNYLVIYGERAVNGLLIITTKRGDSEGYVVKQQVPGVFNHVLQGYHRAREFYVPDYSMPIASQERMHDLRTTIHWEPNMVTDDRGEAVFEFYTADSPGTYRIVVEGLNVDGRLARHVHYIVVE